MAEEPTLEEVDLEYDGGAMDCGSGLLLAITTRMRRIEPGQVLLLHTREPSPTSTATWGTGVVDHWR